MAKKHGTITLTNLRMVGIPRRLDKLGRVVLPKELRELFGISNGSEVEILSCSEGMLVRKAGYSNMHKRSD